MKRIKERWGISGNLQLITILFVFCITGSTSVYLAKPILSILGIVSPNFSGDAWQHIIYWTLRILVVFPTYQILLVIYGALFGQFQFFWSFEKRMLGRIGLGFLIK